MVKLIEKTCSKCGLPKTLEHFSPNRATRDGRQSRCKECHAAHSRSKYDYRKARGWYLTKQLRITVEDYERMYAQQDGCCATCGIKEESVLSRSGLVLRLQVDHDHRTGKVRGLLCSACNRLLAEGRDRPEVFCKLWAYVEKHAAAENLEKKEIVGAV